MAHVNRTSWHFMLNMSGSHGLANALGKQVTLLSCAASQHAGLSRQLQPYTQPLKHHAA